MSTTPFTRSSDERMLGGVCAGLAAHLGMPVLWVRIGMVLFGLLGGAGVILYIWLWVLVPSGGNDEFAPMRRALTRPANDREQASGGATATETIAHGAQAGAASAGLRSDDSRQEGSTPENPTFVGAAVFERAKSWPIAELLLGACLLVVGVGFALVQFGVQLRLDLMLPALAVLAGLALTWWQIADRNRPEKHMLPRVLGALALVAVGVLMFFVTAGSPSALTIVGAALAVLAGVALALAPWALRMNRELIAERSAREREAERAEIAAHLHDSVLQTLAAIQQRSEPGSEIARLARGQERDLREWLFRAADGAEPAPHGAIESELRAHAAMLEEEHAVRFEVVSVGGTRAVPGPLFAAAREAMLNAARHAGGEVTVYIEVTPALASIDVTDRGEGIDLDNLPDGRMGVRESIIGRMQRAGGTARIVTGPGGAGASVRLSMPLDAPAEELAASGEHTDAFVHTADKQGSETHE